MWYKYSLGKCRRLGRRTPSGRLLPDDVGIIKAEDWSFRMELAVYRARYNEYEDELFLGTERYQFSKVKDNDFEQNTNDQIT